MPKPNDCEKGTVNINAGRCRGLRVLLLFLKYECLNSIKAL